MTSRFRFSAPDSRGPSDPWFRIGTLEVTTTVFVVLLGVVSMIAWAASAGSAFDPLAFSAASIRKGEVWRLVTYTAFIEPSLSAVISLALFWVFGRDIESLLGRRRFLIFLVVVTLVPAIFATIFNLRIGSPSGSTDSMRFLELATFVAFVAERPLARFFFGIPAWGIAAVILGIELLQDIGHQLWGTILFLLVACLTSVLLLRACGFGEAVAKFVPAIPIPGLRDGPRRRTRRPKSRRGNAAAEPRPVVVQGPWQPTSPDEIARQARIDSLLDKIAATGLDSLTADERKWLNDASKRSRDDRR